MKLTLLAAAALAAGAAFAAYLTAVRGFEGDIGWNFSKFLVDPSGTVVARYPSGVEPTSAELTAKLESILPKK